MRYHYISTQMDKIELSDNTNVGQDVEWLEFSYIIGGSM